MIEPLFTIEVETDSEGYLINPIGRRELSHMMNIEIDEPPICGANRHLLLRDAGRSSGKNFVRRKRNLKSLTSGVTLMREAIRLILLGEGIKTKPLTWTSTECLVRVNRSVEQGKARAVLMNYGYTVFFTGTGLRVVK